MILVALGLVLVVVVAVSALQGPSQADRDHDAKSKACTAAVNRLNQINIRDGYPGYTKAEAVQRYSACMDNPAVDSRGNLVPSTSR